MFLPDAPPFQAFKAAVSNLARMKTLGAPLSLFDATQVSQLGLIARKAKELAALVAGFDVGLSSHTHTLARRLSARSRSEVNAENARQVPLRHSLGANPALPSYSMAATALGGLRVQAAAAAPAAAPSSSLVAGPAAAAATTSAARGPAATHVSSVAVDFPHRVPSAAEAGAAGVASDEGAARHVMGLPASSSGSSSSAYLGTFHSSSVQRVPGKPPIHPGRSLQAADCSFSHPASVELGTDLLALPAPPAQRNDGTFDMDTDALEAPSGGFTRTGDVSTLHPPASASASLPQPPSGLGLLRQHPVSAASATPTLPLLTVTTMPALPVNSVHLHGAAFHRHAGAGSGLASFERAATQGASAALRGLLPAPAAFRESIPPRSC